jgi:hypothetical protein
MRYFLATMWPTGSPSVIGSHVTRPAFLRDVAIRGEAKGIRKETGSNHNRSCAGIRVWGR